MQNTYIQGLFQSRFGTADYALVTGSLHYNDSLITWTVVHMTAAKLKPLIFSISGFALSNVKNIFIFMILDDFCLLSAWLYYVIINVWNLENLMHIANLCAPRKISNGEENLILLQALQFNRWDSAANSQAGQYYAKWTILTPYIWVTLYSKLMFSQKCLRFLFYTKT
jgi:hypothetical protein